MEIQPIGTIQSCFREKFGTPRQPHLAPHTRALLRLDARQAPMECLDGLDQFSHLWLIFGFHLNTNRRQLTKVRPPRLGGERRLGSLATRTPHRPNPLGLSVVRLLSIRHNELSLAEVDLVDGTPIFDIKPYVRSSDCRPQANCGWLENHEFPRLQVQFSPQALLDLEQHQQTGHLPDRFRELVCEVLSQDPRPAHYKAENHSNPQILSTHGVRLYNYNVRFRVEKSLAQVLSVVDETQTPHS